MDPELPTQLLPAVPHFTFSIFNIAIPNLIAWIVVVLVFVAGAWARLPRIFGRSEPADRATPRDQTRKGEPL